MTGQFRVTYQICTPESAERGDYSEHGFCTAGGGRDPIEVAMSEPIESYQMDLRAARNLVWPIEDCGFWFANEPSTLSYRDGSDISYSLHPPENITAASYDRLRRLFGIRA